MPNPSTMAMDEEWDFSPATDQDLLWDYFDTNEKLIKAKMLAGNATSMIDASKNIFRVRELTQRLQRLATELVSREGS